MAGGYGSEKLPYTHDRVPLPENLRDLPRYLSQFVGGFFTRFSYILQLVWDTGHWILFLMTFMALFQGVTPVIGSLISKHVLNSLQDVIYQGSPPESSFWSSDLFYLLILLFVYRILTQIVSHIHRALTRIAGEKVVRQVKTQIMEKSKTLDIASFDDPSFYERMENASREAGSRPLSILTQCFSIVSTMIEFVSFLAILMTAPGLAWATLVIMAISIPSAVVNFIYRKKNFQYIRRRSKERRQMDYYSGLLVDKDRIKEVRMYDLADLFIGRYQEAFATYYKGLRRLIFSENAWHMAIGILSGITNLVFYVPIARQVFTGQIMIGDYTLYTSAIASIVTCINTLINSSGSIYEGTLFIDNLILFMNEPQTVVPRATPAATVSGGQWQKLAVARAFYSDADILILDEPTASLDPLTEQEIFNQFDALRRHKTTIFVSHRLSSATIADQIVVLEQGRVIENGNHAELMKLHGKYYELFSTQAKRYAA